ncbi:MAG: serine acetyltransferase [Planctomycetes bacterium]|nr:serine acetyltransferase [Planctomycetota bacterium]
MGERSLREVLAGDFARLRGRPPGAFGIARGFFDPRFCPVLLCRIGGALSTAGWRRLSAPWFMLARVVFGLEVARQTRIGPGLVLPHANGVVIGASQVGSNATIFQGVTLGAKDLDILFDPSKRPVLGAGVTVGAGAKVLGGITLGDGVTVGANAVVLEDVPAGCTVVGIPARSVGESAS